MEKRMGNRDFSKYITLSVLGMLGSSGTILADTFFIANKLGADGLAALNLSVSVFGLINGLGMMLGIGGAARYAICKSKGENQEADRTFTLALLTAVFCGVVLNICGTLFSGPMVRLLGADNHIFPMCQSYLRTVLCFAPFFILNHFFIAFLRNDGSPKLAMTAMLMGSLCNIVLDYLLIYPMDMGMFGAAFATGCAPVIGLLTSSIHILTRKNQFHPVKTKISWKEIRKFSGLGISAFINEFSSGFVLVVLNLLILHMTGTVGVAAYGIIANLALIALAVFTGISQGIQPLISRAYGQDDRRLLQNLYQKGLWTASVIGVLFFGIAWIWTGNLVSVFNSERDMTLQIIAENGLRIYFSGFLLVGGSFVTTAFFSATEKAKEAFVTSFFRGFAGILMTAVLSAFLWGLTGVWISFGITEGITVLICWFLMRRKRVVYIKTQRIDLRRIILRKLKSRWI